MSKNEAEPLQAHSGPDWSTGPRGKTQANLDDIESSVKRWSKKSSVTRRTSETGEPPPKFLIDHPVFTGIVMTGICINALQMGLELQLRDDPWKTVWMMMEHFFTAFFLVECSIKLMVLGVCTFFRDRLNCLDFLVVVAAVVDNWIIKVFVGGEASGLGFMSILRLVRLSRILKLLRAKKELMLLLEGIISSIRSMFWLSILLCILVYTSGICFVLFIGESDAYDDDEEFDNKHYFGDLISACVTGLNLALLADWEDVIRPIAHKQPWFAIGLCAYVAISCFGIMNAIIGVIVTRTAEASDQSKQDDLYEYRMNQMDIVENIKEIVYSIDTSGDGCVSKEEILAAEDNEELKAVLEEVELPYAFSLEDLHTMLDKDGDGELSAAEFFIGMRRLVFSNDFQRECIQMHAVQQVKRKIFEVREEMQENSEQMTKRLIKLLDNRTEAILHAVAKVEAKIEKSRPAETGQGNAEESNEKKEANEGHGKNDNHLGGKQDGRVALDESSQGRSNSNRKEPGRTVQIQNELTPSNQGDVRSPSKGKIVNNDSLIIKTQHAPLPETQPASLRLARSDSTGYQLMTDSYPQLPLPGSPERPQDPKSPPPILHVSENEEGSLHTRDMMLSPGLSPLRGAAQDDLQDKIRTLEATIKRLNDELAASKDNSTGRPPDQQRHPATDVPQKLTTPSGQNGRGARKKGVLGIPPNESTL